MRTLVIENFVDEIGQDFAALVQDNKETERIFENIGFVVSDVWRFDDEFEISLSHEKGSVRIIGDPSDELWMSNADIRSKYGEGGYCVVSIEPSANEHLEYLSKLLISRFGGVEL